MSTKGLARVDIHPGYFPYEDNGCGGACVRSLECPFPQCIHDTPYIRARTARAAKRERVRQLRAAGFTIVRIAREIGVSTRTVARFL